MIYRLSRILQHLQDKQPLLQRFLQHADMCCVPSCTAGRSALVRRLSSAQDATYIVTNKEKLQRSSCGNFAAHVLGSAGAKQDRTALVCSETGRTLSYGVLRDACSRWGGYLRQRGVGRGSVVAVMSPNTIDYPSVLLGSLAVGGVYTGVNPTYTPREVAYQLADSGTDLLVVYGPLADTARQALAIAKKDIPMVAIGPSADSGLPNVADIVADRSIDFAEPAQLTGTERMAVLYSSGTTGKPKGVSISHGAAVVNLDMLTHPKFNVGSLSTGEVAKFTLLLPIFHISGLMILVAQGLLTGHTLVLFPKFNPETFVDKLMEHKVNILQLVPSLLNFLLAHPKFTRENFSFVDALVTGASPVPSSAVAAFLERTTDTQVIQMYGMTECLVTHQDPLGGTRLGYTGQILPGLEGKVVDTETGETLPPSQTGELCVRGPTTMQGYINNAAATAETVDEDGWLRSGDVGHYDSDGHVTVIDRRKELIKVNALQVSPSEIEDVILQLPEVTEASVVGVPHDRTGEAPRAYVVVRDGFDVNKVVQHVQQNCAPHKHLRGGVAVLPALPKNATGKVLRRKLVELATQGQ